MKKVFIRGSHKNLGNEVPRRFLEALDSAPTVDQTGRFELAKQIADPANPLTARVFANRIWHHLFGRGIVPSTDNFGVLGEAPRIQHCLIGWPIISSRKAGLPRKPSAPSCFRKPIA